FRFPTSDFRFAGLWLDGFAALTPQELDLLVALIPHCEEATLAFCLDPKAKARSWLSHWSVVQKTVAQCGKKLGALPGAVISEILLPEDSKRIRFAAPALAHLEGAWSAAEITQHATGSTKNGTVRLVTCADPDAEAIFAAREILKFV